MRSHVFRPRRQIYGSEGRNAPEAVTRLSDWRLSLTDKGRKLDDGDPLAFARARFQLPDKLIYLDGNSLGALPRGAPERLAQTAIDQWGKDLIASWNRHCWIDWPTQVAAKLAPIVGAGQHELLIADSTSVCLFKLLSAAVRARPGRTAILTQKDNFPTDLYVAEGLAGMLGLDLLRVEADAIIEAIDHNTAAVMLTHVDYRSAARHDMAAINQAATRAGALTLWDLSHSAGALELDLNGTGCDLAVGCGYKYLNGGPGAPAFIFVADHLQNELDPQLRGWMGHAEPFDFNGGYRAAQGIQRFLTGTPSILALAALDAGLSTFAGIEMSDIVRKSRSLSSLFIDEVEARTLPDLRLASPADAAARGSHVIFTHPNGYAVMQALIARGVIGDFRTPDVLRFGFAPLYNRFSDVVSAADALSDILQTREWDQPHFHRRSRVT